MESAIELDAVKSSSTLRQMSKVKKMFRFAVLWLFILVQNLYFSLVLPFLTHEIIETRKQGAILGGVLAGIFTLVGAATSMIAGFVASKTTFKKMAWWSGVALFLSSIVFVIPMSNNVMFDATVFVSRYTS